MTLEFYKANRTQLNEAMKAGMLDYTWLMEHHDDKVEDVLNDLSKQVTTN